MCKILIAAWSYIDFVRRGENSCPPPWWMWKQALLQPLLLLICTCRNITRLFCFFLLGVFLQGGSSTDFNHINYVDELTNKSQSTLPLLMRFTPPGLVSIFLLWKLAYLPQVHVVVATLHYLSKTSSLNWPAYKQQNVSHYKYCVLMFRVCLKGDFKYILQPSPQSSEAKNCMLCKVVNQMAQVLCRNSTLHKFSTISQYQSASWLFIFSTTSDKISLVTLEAMIVNTWRYICWDPLMHRHTHHPSHNLAGASEHL